ALDAFKRWSADQPVSQHTAQERYDVFVSYAHEDTAVAEQVVNHLLASEKAPKVFIDRLAIDTGASWQQEIYECLAECRKVLVLVSPSFLASKVCQEELNIALVRNRRSDRPITHPLYILSAELPPHIEVLNYVDCREANIEAIREACANLVRTL